MGKIQRQKRNSIHQEEQPGRNREDLDTDRDTPDHHVTPVATHWGKPQR
jgi:hypothetical protein